MERALLDLLILCTSFHRQVLLTYPFLEGSRDTSSPATLRIAGI